MSYSLAGRGINLRFLLKKYMNHIACREGVFIIPTHRQAIEQGDSTFTDDEVNYLERLREEISDPDFED